MVAVAILVIVSMVAILFLLLCLYNFCMDERPQFIGYLVEVERTKRQTLRFPQRESRPEQPRAAAGARYLMAFTLAAVLLGAAADGRAQVSVTSSSAPSAQSTPWQFGGFVDFAYLHSFNDPANHLFRNRGTTFKLNEPALDMAAAYIRKAATEQSRWGAELTVQAGEDSEVFGFSATAPNLPGANGLRHLGPTDVSYLAPIGKGLTIQGGIFSSLIGYDSLYARDNLNYTRPWGADYTPYLMFGVNAAYPFTAKLTGTFFVVNGYWHLGNANSVPSSGTQLAYKATDHTTLKQTVMYGPHQADTSLEFWRFLSDSIAEWKRDPVTIAFEYQLSTERVATATRPRAYWSAAQLPMHWVMDERKHWSASLRPEFAWDSDGRWTGYRQTVKAVTTTLEYRVPYKQATGIFRLEYRHDDSRGPSGGFFTDGTTSSVRLTPAQDLLVFGVILAFDGQFRTK